MGFQSSARAGSPLGGLFSQLFGHDDGDFRRGNTDRTDGADVFQVLLTMEELFRGGTKRFEVQLQATSLVNRARFVVQKEYSVTVVPGWKEGTRISFGSSKLSYPGVGPLQLPPVTFLVKQAPHRYFDRVGDDLVVKIRLTQAQAQRKSNTMSIPMLDGSKFSFVAKERIRHGTIREFPDLGMPIKGGPGRGNLFVEFTVVDQRRPRSPRGFH